MLVSLNWLKQYVDIDGISPEELAEKITKSGIEVDGMERFASPSTNVVVGYVESCEKHPDADKLNVCQVNTGEETLQIICGAPNVKQGQKVAVAKPGAVLPGNFKIKKVKLRGIESNGMICSLQELGIDEKYVPKESADGIYVFHADAEIGADVTPLLNLDDYILELDLTPNRSDALSMLGMAYEVAAILDVPVKLPEPSYEETVEKATDLISVKVEAKEENPYYAAFVIKNVTIGPSPLWMRNYLMASGIRPINNVVDITNYVLLEYGQPLHAFDLDKFSSDEVVVRKAKENETLVTLDGQERKLNTEHLVITDGKDPVALAGVMGGQSTEVSEETTNVLLEAAYFEGQIVRRASKEFDLRSESSTRFEKGVDPNRVRLAGERACQLLSEYANGSVLAGNAEFDQLDKTEKTVTIETSRINNRLGTEISEEEIIDILRKLQFNYEKTDGEIIVHAPTRRQDIRIFEDMVEEVARIYGYDHLPYTLPTGEGNAGGLTKEQELKRYVKRFLEGAGLSETVTYSLTSEARSEQLISPDVKNVAVSKVKLAMPMSEDHGVLRLSLLPEMLDSASYNIARKQTNIAMYEIGSVFISNEEKVTKQPKENLRLSGVLTGEWVTHPWQQEKKKVDFFVVKGILDELFERLNVNVTYTATKIENMHPGRTAELSINNKVIGFAGQLHPLLEKEYDLNETYVFDIDYDYLVDIHENEPSFSDIPRYPGITRDIALVVEHTIQSGDIQRVIQNAGGDILQSIRVFDVYQGEHLEETKKSMAFSLFYQDPEHTLTDKEVEESYERILEAVKNEFNAELRS
ncbi:phenylalanyl-tRNA synthetase beta chain [Gracilibacillus halotolerans]|uniref:Phenylalanine--tRNA ligase beta subunit n=1 Tax=Gracilibacillus halotolerans TaxID=74386 RepID=A0A841RSF7_9BACI|nr:phenylalanine--tRNA ligase subunit beta [Gracilibacillus halotolerans]MBB6513874.1 phenylalanyl-tRNA synthetase beta chain [Gracilibacillus halotolerans]